MRKTETDINQLKNQTLNNEGIATKIERNGKEFCKYTEQRKTLTDHN